MEKEKDKTPKRDPNTGRFAGKKKDKATANTHGLGMGVNSRREHQKIIRNVIYNLTQLYSKGQLSPLEPYSETSYKYEHGGEAPDISLYKEDDATWPIILEITTREGFTGDINKSIRQLIAQDFGIKEAFVHDFELGRWMRLRLVKGKVVQEEGISTTLLIKGLDFAKLTGLKMKE